MDELEAFELSCQIEPLNQTTQNSGSKESRFRRRITPLGQHRKNDSIASTVSGSSNSSTPMHYETDGSVRDDDESKMTASLNDSLRSRVSSASSACSTPSIDTSLASLGTPSRSDRVSDNPGDPAPDPFRTPEFYIIRVSLESSTEATEGNVIYFQSSSKHLEFFILEEYASDQKPFLAQQKTLNVEKLFVKLNL